MALEQTINDFAHLCSRLSERRDERVKVLYPAIRGLVWAAYAGRGSALRDAEDLIAGGAVGLLEGLDAGLLGADLAAKVLERAEAMRVSINHLSDRAKYQLRDWDSDDDAPGRMEGHASPLPSPEEMVMTKHDGPEPTVRRIGPRTRDLRPAIARLPEKDRRLVHAYYHQRKTVRQLGAELGVSGMAVSYRLRRIRDRLRVLVELPELTDDGIRRDLADVVSPQRIEGYDPLEALVSYHATMSQSETAERLGVAQERVSYTVTQAVRRLADIHQLAKYHKAFSIIQRHGLMWSRR